MFHSFVFLKFLYASCLHSNHSSLFWCRIGTIWKAGLLCVCSKNYCWCGLMRVNFIFIFSEVDYNFMILIPTPLLYRKCRFLVKLIAGTDYIRCFSLSFVLSLKMFQSFVFFKFLYASCLHSKHSSLFWCTICTLWKEGLLYVCLKYYHWFGLMRIDF